MTSTTETRSHEELPRSDESEECTYTQCTIPLNRWGRCAVCDLPGICHVY